ncbi:MAG: GAF domain-containing protein, partial [Candidatus Latescibacteria bacterium]|nr:GAF domain-containing protein [Candidatus Latescibacterota bacterium]
KVKELEGKDQITQHLLSLHTLENTLIVVLEVISDVLEIDKAIVHLKQGDAFQPAAAIGLVEPHVVVPKDQLKNSVATSTLTQAMDTVVATHEAINSTQFLNGDQTPFALIPILRDNELLGVIEVDKHRRQESLDETEVETLTSFALQAAVAIYDAQIQQNDSQWNQQVEGAFDLDDVLRDSDQLGDLDQK